MPAVQVPKYNTSNPYNSLRWDCFALSGFHYCPAFLLDEHKPSQACVLTNMAAPDTVQVRARCLCGANKFSWHVAATALPLDASVCHCDSCRHGTGTLGFTACTWPLPLPSEGELVNCSKSAFSSRADVYFCTSCGTLLFWHSDALPWLGLAVGALENPKSWCKMTLHMCLADTRDGGMSVWLDNVQNNRLKKHLTHDLSAEAGDDWMAKMPSQGDSGHDNLQASCRCGGVKFQVTRPTEQSGTLVTRFRIISLLTDTFLQSPRQLIPEKRLRAEVYGGFAESHPTRDTLQVYASVIRAAWLQGVKLWHGLSSQIVTCVVKAARRFRRRPSLGPSNTTLAQRKLIVISAVSAVPSFSTFQSLAHGFRMLQSGSFGARLVQGLRIG